MRDEKSERTQIRYYLEQVAALKAYNDLVVKGYNVVKDGLALVHDIRNGEFNLHRNYFNAIREVNAALIDDNALKIYHAVIQQANVTISLTPNFGSAQRTHIQGLIENVERKAEKV